MIYWLIALGWLACGILSCVLWGKRWRSIDLGIIIVSLVFGPFSTVILLLLLAGEFEWRW